MDKACEDDESREVEPQDDRRSLYRLRKFERKRGNMTTQSIKDEKRNEVERMFGMNKENRRIATRYDKLSCMHLSFDYLAFLKFAQDKLVGTHSSYLRKIILTKPKL